MRVVKRAVDSEAFLALSASPLARPSFPLPLSPLGRRYYAAVHGDSVVDLSFCLTEGETALALVECDVNSASLGRFGFPLEIRLAPRLDFNKLRRIVREIFGLLYSIAPVNAARQINIRSNRSSDPDGLVDSLALGQGWLPHIEIRAIARLNHSDEELLQDLRKGHRQQVRWGQQHLKICTVDKLSPSRSVFDIYREFHARVAGRVTRSLDSWNIMFEAIAEGKGDLVVAWFNQRLVSGTLVMDSDSTAYYASGVYDREQFDKPLAHYPLFLAMTRARERGCSHFDVGEVPFEASTEKKGLAIGYFKRGFTSRIETNIIWTFASQIKS